MREALGEREFFELNSPIELDIQAIELYTFSLDSHNKLVKRNGIRMIDTIAKTKEKKASRSTIACPKHLKYSPLEKHQ